MMKILTLPLGSYQTNTYILYNEGAKPCLIVDPGYEAGEILHYVNHLDLEVEAILLTHGHFDHVGAVRQIAAETDCKVYLHPADLSMPPMMTAGPLYYTDTYDEGTKLDLAGLTVHVLHTPGHTPGSVCLLVGDVMLSGDTLFAGSCGRTDLPGGDWATITRSLDRLSRMQINYRVLPGHGSATTLDAEKRSNPYLR